MLDVLLSPQILGLLFLALVIIGVIFLVGPADSPSGRVPPMAAATPPATAKA